jgi:hypothetical protein
MSHLLPEPTNLDSGLRPSGIDAVGPRHLPETRDALDVPSGLGASRISRPYPQAQVRLGSNGLPLLNYDRTILAEVLHLLNR